MEEETAQRVLPHCGQEEPAQHHEPAGLEVVLQQEGKTQEKVIDQAGTCWKVRYIVAHWSCWFSISL